MKKEKKNGPETKEEKKARILLEELEHLSDEDLVARAKFFSDKFIVEDGENFNLNDFETSIDFGLGSNSKSLVNDTLELGVEALADMQEVLYAQDKWSLLLVFQAMDAAGKDGAIKHVLSGVNPQGCQVSSFKKPSSEDLDHDFLWRCQKHLPERGRIGIFNRSYYEEVLVVRVHEDILQGQKLDKKLITKNIWEERFEDIRNFEKYLTRNGTIVIKFFLNVSKDEQKQRFIDRIDDVEKNWKFSTADAHERGFWDQYMAAYQDLIKNTATPDSPWYIIPADNKSYARIIIASAILNALNEMDLEYPKVSKEKMAELQEIKKALLNEK